MCFLNRLSELQKKLHFRLCYKGSMLQIIDVAYQSKKAMIPSNSTKSPYMLVEDVTQPYQYDFVVTLIDEAKITKDGPVVGGNKIKIGLPIVLEGFNYRIGGTISNVQILENKALPVINKYVEQQKALQKLQQLQTTAAPSSNITQK